MPLHLLGKKSWNVYNPANIERVRRDEAAAQAREEEAERRMDEYDAARRIAVLRGEKPPSPPPDLVEDGHKPRHGSTQRGSKRRRLAGEDDTDRDIRVARETAEQGRELQEQLVKFSQNKETSDAPLMDHRGHIDLFPMDHKAMRKAEKNAGREAEEAKKKQELEDLYTMRFANAAGRGSGGKPWYTNTTKGSAVGVSGDLEEPGKDVWGREDPGRKNRERMRMDASDPLAFMKKAQVQLKESERDRKRWATDRERDMMTMRAPDEDKSRSGRRRRYLPRQNEDVDIGELEGFSLDPIAAKEAKPRHERKHEHRSSRHHKRHRSRSRSWDKEHHRFRRDKGKSKSRSRSPDTGRHRSHRSSRKRSRSRESRRDHTGRHSSRHRLEQDERRKHDN